MLLDEILTAERAGRIKLEPFNYSAQFPIAAFLAGATLAVNVAIQNDSDFVWRYTTLVSWSAAGVLVVAPDYTIAFNDTGAGRNMQDQAIHVNCITGNGQFPYILPEPRRLAAASVLIVTMTNVGGPAALAYVTLSGFKVYALSAYVR